MLRMSRAVKTGVCGSSLPNKVLGFVLVVRDEPWKMTSSLIVRVKGKRRIVRFTSLPNQKFIEGATSIMRGNR